MAFVQLPALPRQARISPRVLRFGNDLTSSFGGPSQRILRLGARYAVEVSLPPMGLAAARAWLAARERAEAEGATLRLTLPQYGDASAVTGRTATVGAGATMGISNAAGVEVGFWFTVVVGGRAYLHRVTEVTGLTLRVAPLLRVDPAGAALNFVAPEIEGFADEVAWDLKAMRWAGQTFTITERR